MVVTSVDSDIDATGVIVGTIGPNVYVVLLPQALTAVTEMVPVTEPMVTGIVLVVLVPLHPPPVTVHT